MSDKTSSEKQGDFSGIFWNATNFENSSIILDREMSRSIASTQKTVRFPFLVPTIVLRAFSIELYLKCLIGIETGRIPRGHELAKLYPTLSEQSRKILKEKFDSFTRSNPALKGMQNHFGKEFVLSLAIEDVLAVVNKVFETWRYFYEGNAGSSYGLGELSRAIRETIIVLHPEFTDISPVGIEIKPMRLFIIDTTDRYSCTFKGADLDWERLTTELLANIKHMPEGIRRNITHTNHKEYKLLDVDKECWITPPKRAATFYGRKIALVHNNVIKTLKISRGIHQEGTIRGLLKLND